MKDMPWHRSMGNIPIDKIKVGSRRREDMGDINALAKSIEEHGLLHPVVLDIWNNLVAGHRRLEACKKLGWEAIPYREIGEVDEQKLREIELRENLDRKDFTELELSRNMAALVGVVGERLRTSFPPNLGGKPKAPTPQGGRPAGSIKPDSQSAIAREIGVPQQSLSDAVAHVEAVKKYPILETVPKTTAINIARSAKEKPPFERQQYVEDRAEMERMLSREFKMIDAEHDIAKEMHRAIHAPLALKIDPERVEAWLNASTFMSKSDWDMQINSIQSAIEKLQQLEALLKDRMKLRIIPEVSFFEDR